MKTKIFNATTHVLVIKLDSGGRISSVPPMQEFMMESDPCATYREYSLVVGNHRIIISSDDLEDVEEIRVLETPTQSFVWRASKRRVSNLTPWSTYEQARGSIRDSTDFDAVKKDVFSRMKSIKNSQASLVVLSKLVKICPARCGNLVQTCLEGVKEMKEAHDEKSEDDMWLLYNSKKLGQLISSLVKLLSTLRSVQDLLQACGINWGSMALVVSLPLPPPERMSSQFDILLKELHWNLETIHYALHLNGGVEFKWNDRKVRYVLDGPGVTVAEDMDPEKSGGLASADREHLQSQLANGSILVRGNPLLNFLWGQFATYHRRDKLAAELQKRLKETAVLSNDLSSIPDCFWINIANLKLRKKLSGNSLNSVWKGEWCGQTVAIRVTKFATNCKHGKATVKKEAGIMLKVQHPNIVGFIGCGFTDDAPPPVRSGENDKCSAGYIVMECMQEDLRHVIDRCAKNHSGNPFPLADTMDILFQIAGAMVHMHNFDIMHRDLKSANCLVNLRSSSNSSPQVLKLIDFELSKELDRNAPITNHTARSGTVRWMAPEVWGSRLQMPTARKGHWFHIRGLQMFGALV